MLKLQFHLIDDNIYQTKKIKDNEGIPRTTMDNFLKKYLERGRSLSDYYIQK